MAEPYQKRYGSAIHMTVYYWQNRTNISANSTCWLNQPRLARGAREAQWPCSAAIASVFATSSRQKASISRTWSMNIAGLKQIVV